MRLKKEIREGKTCPCFKRRYKLRDAKIAASKTAKMNSKEMFVYLCPYSHFYHLTSKPQYG